MLPDPTFDLIYTQYIIKTTNAMLDRHWFSEPVYDFELKKYQFLAFEESARSELSNKMIFPWVSHFSEMRNSILSFIEKKKYSNKLRRRAVKAIDFEKKRLRYSMHKDVIEFSTVEETIQYVLPRIEDLIHHSSTMLNTLIDKLQFETIGLYSGRPSTGILLLNHCSGLHTYTYEKGLVKYDGNVKLNWVNVHHGVPNFISLKKEVLSVHKDISSQTWLVTGGEDYPLKESLEPTLTEVIYKLV